MVVSYPNESKPGMDGSLSKCRPQLSIAGLLYIKQAHISTVATWQLVI